MQEFFFFIPRLSLTPSDVMIPFKFQRRQVPIAVSFAMTINKSQGQSLKKVEIYLQVMCFHTVSYMCQYQELPPEMD
ncbi:putative P-loop containing nucleoside triphosphate hydrolase [Medicago truncatula]|uniref:Putative P-loop containing nucleoside triphosphate hydrolase n=1 Tax=Medicago truncatula TaxID=3880 RepID=A0A396IWR6_MEDTR|nr:putative P-loop containing nucleoside triphosphate hydrolase [Medicago truncatula]